MATTPQTGHRSVSPLALAWAESLPDGIESAGDPEWLGEIRVQAARAFARDGLPGNKDEAWKYTSLRRLESLAPALRGAAEDSVHDAWKPAVEVGADFGFRWVDGRWDISGTELPAGVRLWRLDDALRSGRNGIPERLRRLFESVELDGRSRAFEALNTALLGSGAVIHVAAGVDAGRCEGQWMLPPRAGSGLHNARLCVLLDAGARLELIEQHIGASADRSENPQASNEADAQALNLLVQVDLEPGARLDHVRVQNENPDGVLLTFADVRQAASSRYAYAGFDTGGGLVRHAIRCALEGENAHASVHGAFVTNADGHVDYHICVDHRAPGCSSEQFFRGVLGGHSRGVFNGKAIIRPGADGSKVRQSNANLLLSREAEMDTKPELEIYADEVEASHGATVGQMDEAAVFYLRSRGLTEEAAHRMLTTAFCRAVADRLEDRTLAASIANLLEAAMPQQETDSPSGSGDRK